jgi:signal transduction histidine kinase
MQRLWWRRALEQRLGSLAAAAILLWTAGTAIAASIATDRIATAVLAEREPRARAIAARIDRLLEDDLRHLDLVAAASAASSPALDAQVRTLKLAEYVVRVAPSGEVLWTRHVPSGQMADAIVTRLPSQFAERHIAASGSIATARGPRAFLFVPARESDDLRGVVGAAVDPQRTLIGEVLASYAQEPYRVELLDADRREIGSSRPPMSHGTLPDDELVIAQSPLSNGAWQLRVVQPRSEVLAPVFTLRRILVGSSLLLIPFAVLIALATARSIQQPVLAMTAAAERLVRGDFADVVPPAGEDEIGRLAQALEKLRKTLEADERRSLLLKRVISAQEEERRRIARELHDQTTQQLTALAMQLHSAAGTDAPTRALLDRSRALVATMIDDVHRLIYDLRPSMLDDLGLLPAIRTYADKHLTARGIQVHCEFPPATPPLSPEATTALYRVVQEALSNIARHAQASTVLIGCTVNAHHITIEVEDDGVGFDPTRVERPRDTGEGLGLLGMRERLGLLGGRLDIESERGQGTRVVALLPLTPATTAVAERRA